MTNLFPWEFNWKADTFLPIFPETYMWLFEDKVWLSPLMWWLWLPECSLFAFYCSFNRVSSVIQIHIPVVGQGRVHRRNSYVCYAIILQDHGQQTIGVRGRTMKVCLQQLLSVFNSVHHCHWLLHFSGFLVFLSVTSTYVHSCVCLNTDRDINLFGQKFPVCQLSLCELRQISIFLSFLVHKWE